MTKTHKYVIKNIRLKNFLLLTNTLDNIKSIKYKTIEKQLNILIIMVGIIIIIIIYLKFYYFF